MEKNKDFKKRILSWRFVLRVLIINMAAYFVLIMMLLTGNIGWKTATFFFVVITILTALITAIVFKELESFINYMKKLSETEEVKTPSFHHGIFGSRRLSDAFLKVRAKWLNQSLSDAAILDNLPDPLLMLDDDLRIVFINKLAQDIFRPVILNHKIDRFCRPETVNAIRHILQRHNSGWIEWDFKDKEESILFRVRVQKLPVPAKNEATGVLVFHDITPFKIFEKQQADFFANASHELKTPLSIISGFIETLQGPAKDDEQAREKFLTMMAEQTTRMTKLVQNLLSLSRLQMENKDKQTDVILIPDLLQNAVQDLSIRAEQHHKKLELKIEHELPRLIGNRVELQQVVQNLIDNAIKYGGEETTITVSGFLCNHFPKKSSLYFDDMRQIIGISVHNWGNPIPKGQAKRLFDRFYRMDSLKTKQVEGTGLGLGIVQQIVQRHEGMIDVWSSEKRGTIFTVYLPVNF